MEFVFGGGGCGSGSGNGTGCGSGSGSGEGRAATSGAQGRQQQEALAAAVGQHLRPQHQVLAALGLASSASTLAAAAVAAATATATATSTSATTETDSTGAASSQQLYHQQQHQHSQISSPASSDLNGPPLFTEPNRTSAIDDIRSGAIYIFVITIFVSFLLILPGIRSDKFPTFFCVTTSLLVTSIILVSLIGTAWHVGEAPQMSAAYKAFSRDRIQGELRVNIGLQSVNITLRAHKYYIMHQLEGPIVLMDSGMVSNSGGLLASLMPLAPVTSVPPPSQEASTSPLAASLFTSTGDETTPLTTNSELGPAGNSGVASEFIGGTAGRQPQSSSSNETLADELVGGGRGGASGELTSIDAEEELESEQEIFTNNDRTVASLTGATETATATEAENGGPAKGENSGPRARLVRSSSARNLTSSLGTPQNSNIFQSSDQNDSKSDKSSRSLPINVANRVHNQMKQSNPLNSKPKYTIKRVSHVDINYNERFYWIEPQQMRREYHKALERGLPYPILTVVEYLSQDESGFNWSRQYRLAGYYTSILLWISAGLCALMFCLHCAAPKYGIYTMQLLGLLLLFTNFTYSKLVPSGDKQLVIPFEGHSLAFKFGWNFWLVLFGGCISFVVGTVIVIIDGLIPNYIFTTVLDVDYDSHQAHCRRQKFLDNKKKGAKNNESFSEKKSSVSSATTTSTIKRPDPPAFLRRKKSAIK